MYHAAWYALSQGVSAEAENMAMLSMKVRVKELGHDNEGTWTL